MNIKLKNDIPVCQRARRLSCSEKLQSLSVPSFVCFRFSFGLYGRTAADSVQSGWPIVAAKAKQSSRAGAAKTRTET
ncbi:hypothetical protein TNCV_837671 [Trichonephila clavipes]|nr:hypothetical protein TNCV_837671 [Trichonephila clavipes]